MSLIMIYPHNDVMAAVPAATRIRAKSILAVNPEPVKHFNAP